MISLGKDSCNVVICDHSALNFYEHCDRQPEVYGGNCSKVLEGSYASSGSELRAFNTTHPLFGGEPISVFAPERRLRRNTKSIVAHLISGSIPEGALRILREGLYLTSPEFTYLRMGNYVSENRMAEIGMALCARYFLECGSKRVCVRSRFLTTPERLLAFCESARPLRGGAKAMRALRWVIPNSGSPFETKMKLQFCHPYWKGGLALPFDAMNYDVKAGRYRRMTGQQVFCIDLVSRQYRIGLEYDGEQYHLDSSKDKRRLNTLRALGWDIFPVDKNVLLDAEETERLGYQVAKRMGIRVQKPRSWETRYAELRGDLGLPV